MKTTCLVNSHNYARYVGEAVDSALHQSRPFDEILVVDDGSTDGSADLLRRRYAGESTIRLIVKPQGGQLSCFHRGISEASGDVVFFLDADDCYQSQLLADTVPLYSQHPPVDFVAVGHQRFGQSIAVGSTGDRSPSTPPGATRQWGCSVLATIFGQHWIGAPTSCLSMRTELARSILPYPHEKEWITRADDVLVFGTSIAGGCKMHLSTPLVRYRIHGNNQHANRTFDRVQRMRYCLRVNRLIQWYVEHFGYHPEQLAYHLGREFRTWQRPTFREARNYWQMGARAGVPARTRLEQAAVILAHYLNERRLPLVSVAEGLDPLSIPSAACQRESTNDPATGMRRSRAA